MCPYDIKYSYLIQIISVWTITDTAIPSQSGRKSAGKER